MASLMERWEYLVSSLQNASSEALDIFESTFLAAGDAASNAHVGGEAPPKASKQPFFFGNPEDFSMEELAAGTRSQWSAFKNDVKGFTAAIDWGEPLILALAVFHIFILIVAVLIRKHNELQIVFFCTIMGLVYGAEHINWLAGAHWEKFSTQNYFDKRGVFISTMFSTPLLLVGMVMLFNALVTSSKMLVQVKRKELIHKARAERNGETKKSK